MSPDGFRRYAAIRGEVLARAHSRTADAVILSAYLGKSTAFDDAIGSFALAYARQTDLDHARLVGAIGAGQLPATAQDS